jgi:NNP family nitrate/nitrite transporter-like MFS transporter
VPERLPVDWDPEDRERGAAGGRAIAVRNLCVSVPALFVAFAVWMVWSGVVVRLGDVGFALTTDQLFWLAALPGLSGATLRIFYAFAVPIFGGRRFTAWSTASLLAPAVGVGVVVQDPATPFPALVAVALLCGLGGANFASSMSHVSFLVPRARKGLALGLNGGLGNLGVSGTQALLPLAVGAGFLGALAGPPQQTAAGPVWLQNAALIWVPAIVVCAAAAWLGMNDLASARASLREQLGVLRERHTWMLCGLYLGTFGSFIGFSAALPLLARTQFPGVDPMAWAFLGPLVGSLVRPAGGWLSDRMGGARITVAAFAVMILALGAVLLSLPRAGAAGSFAGFVAAFLVLFAASGVGNGSTFRMIPAVFAALHGRRAGAAPAERAEASRRAARDGAAVVGFSSAVAAYGAFLVPRALGASLGATGGPAAAFVAMALVYAACLAAAWVVYARRGVEDAA